MVEPIGVVVIGVCCAVVGAVCMHFYKKMYPEVPADDPRLREEIKAIDDQITMG